MPRKKALCNASSRLRRRVLRRCNLSQSMPVLSPHNEESTYITQESMRSTPPVLTQIVNTTVNPSNVANHQQTKRSKHPNCLNNKRPCHQSYSEEVVQQNYVPPSILPLISAIHIINENSVKEHHCGPMNLECPDCKSRNFKYESTSRCCAKGKVQLPSLPIYPLELKKLLCGESNHSEEFLRNIRSYNSAFSFASFGANVSPPPGHGPYCFRIHGQIYHSAKPLHPSTGTERKYAQLYILDASAALQARMGYAGNANCSEFVMSLLSKIMDQNPFTQAYKMLHEVELESTRAATAKGCVPPTILMAIKHTRSEDSRRYNDPRVNEVAVVFQNEDGEPPLNRDILIHLKESTQNPTATTKRLSAIDPMTDPMCYPLLFPFGTEGWRENIPLHNSDGTVRVIPTTHEENSDEENDDDYAPEENNTAKRARITHMMFYKYRFCVRSEFNPILHAGKLTQQYQVDAFAKMEANRLNFIRLNQPKLHAENYKILTDYVNGSNLNSGKPVILPTTFEGGDRCQQQRFQDAIAVVRKHGKPTYFITMTCNPKWPEILENMSPQDSPENRADLVSRVFEIKRKMLMEDLTKNNIMGKAEAWIWVREYQKRGLPHVHILLIMDGNNQPNTPERVDEKISAEIPNPASHPRLHALVLRHMVHGPCGNGKSSPCMQDGKCSKKFPKPYQETTTTNVNSYPLYQRRNTGIMYKSGSKNVDNAWIVPYNAMLLLKYNCHINTEVVATIKSVKYLYKYVYKGHDCANLQIQNTTDETVRHVDSRYVCPPEAMDRIWGHKMHANSHNNVRLAIHLDLQQTVYYRVGNEVSAQKKASKNNTTLTAWFQLNQDNADARQYLYTEIPEKYRFVKNLVVNGTKGNWTMRKNSAARVVPRMYTVSPSDRERFFLRLLLLNVRGATSFECLRTVDGILLETFMEAASRLNLVQGDNMWMDTLTESATQDMPSEMRELFAYILIYCHPTNPLNLWETFKHHLLQDYSKRHHDKDVPECLQCESRCLQAIAHILEDNGKSLSAFDLPLPSAHYLQSPECPSVGEEPLEMIENLKMYPEQHSVYNEILKTVQNPGYSNMFFLQGPGGSGKTYIYKTLILSEKAKGRDVIVVASTGIAATLLPGGRTYHSMFKLPVPLNEDSLSSMKTEDPDFLRIKNCSLIIWDEATMAHHHALKSIHRLLTRIMQTNDTRPCGGKTVLMGGDWKQILSVVKRGNRAQIVQSSLKRSHLWPQVKQLKLTVNVRATDVGYAEWLLKVGEGRTEQSGNSDRIVLPNDIITKSAIDHVFPKSFTRHAVVDLARQAILCPTNEAVHAMNREINQRLEGEVQEYLSIDQVESDNPEEIAEYPPEYLNTIEIASIPPHKLQLKPGSIIMLLRNLNTKRQLCNGTRLIVVSLHQHFIHAKKIVTTGHSESVYLPRLALIPSQTDFPIPMKRTQFPVMLAFAMTINKSQGSTLEKVGAYLPNPVFTHGQFYVMCSRVRKYEDIRIQIIEGPQQGQLSEEGQKMWYTNNIVYREVLTN